MEISNKCVEIGITSDLIHLLVSKTKHLKGIPINVELSGIDKFGIYCLHVGLLDNFRSEITLHIDSKRIKILNRQIKIDKLFT